MTCAVDCNRKTGRAVKDRKWEIKEETKDHENGATTTIKSN